MKRLIALVCLLLFEGFSADIVCAETANAYSTSVLSTELNQTADDRIHPDRWLNDTGAVLTRLIHRSSSDGNRVLLYGGITYALYKNDEHIQHWFQDKRSDHTDRLSKIGNAFPTVGTAYFAGAYFLGSGQQRRLAANGLESVAISSTLTQCLKIVSHRQRPNKSDSMSFPSGHTAAAFAVATTIAEEYPDRKAVPYVAYGLAALTAYSRLNQNDHWSSDVFVGALIGHYTAKAVRALNTSRNIGLQPYISSHSTGIVLNKPY